MSDNILQELVVGIVNVMQDKLSDFIVEMNLKYDKLFSVIDIDIKKFQEWENVIPFYQNVNKEGIVLWTAA